MDPRKYYVYILTNALKTVLYIGITNNLQRRILQHWELRGNKNHFTGRYRAHYLLYYESYTNYLQAFARERALKVKTRQKKMDLINVMNPEWNFLNEELLGKWPPDQLF
jgi:putative endonuclease